MTTSPCTRVRAIAAQLLLVAAACSERVPPKGTSTPEPTVVSAPATGGPILHVALVTDRSDSIEHGDGVACATVEKLLRNVIETPGMAPGRTTFSVFATADAATPGLPKSLGELKYPKEKAGMRGREAARRAEVEAVSAFFSEVRKRCDQNATSQKRSPVYGAVKAAIDDLMERIEAPGHEGLLLIQSDMVDNFEESLRIAIAKVIGKKPPARPFTDLKKSLGIDLKNKITVRICGAGQGTDAQQEAPRTRLMKLWEENIFLNAKTFHAKSKCADDVVAQPK